MRSQPLVPTLAFFALFFAAGAAGQGPPIFTPPAVSFPMGGFPTKAVLVDLDGDGRLDVVTAGAQTTTTSIRLGDGAGGFGPASALSGAGPFAMGDLNGDDVPDFAAADVSAQTVKVRLGNGLGGLGAVTSFPATLARSLSLGDVDLDGDLDALVATASPVSPPPVPHARLLLGNGLGAFAAAVAIPGAGGGQDALLVDVTSDGKLDAVSTTFICCPLRIETRIGDGAGGFAGAIGSDLPGGYVVATVESSADANADGFADVTVAQSVDAAVSTATRLLLNDGAGGFLGGGPAFAALQTVRLYLGEVDGDGHPDLLRTDGTANALVVSSGGPSGFTTQTSYVVGQAPVHVAVGDLDGNGRNDAVVTRFDGLAVLKNTLAQPAGIAIYGVGTPGCAGIHGISATSAPVVGNAAFAVVNTGAPPSALGLLLIGNVPDVPGSDPLNIDVLEHVDLFASTLLLGFNAFSDASGYALAAIPIPANPSIVGATVYAQGKWLWTDCLPSTFGLSSSRGMAITLLP